MILSIDIKLLNIFFEIFKKTSWDDDIVACEWLEYQTNNCDKSTYVKEKLDIIKKDSIFNQLKK